ncbi:hypothetical protein Pcinc_008087 [Petrolisthes cinctipes]|uniref:Uncharacterized protein n=1 Tax=Petrolisthes cinctipes TaxID=88211 RepID=A0AAE1GDY9_PETCI|nr:hypothetical protein Pcinc_008087 [Petrolisthes cinctipes]
MTKPKLHRKRLEMEILLDDIHQLEKNGKITTSTALQPTLLAEAAKTRGVYHSKLLSIELRSVSGVAAEAWQRGLATCIFTNISVFTKEVMREPSRARCFHDRQWTVVLLGSSNWATAVIQAAPRLGLYDQVRK